MYSAMVIEASNESAIDFEAVKIEPLEEQKPSIIAAATLTDVTIVELREKLAQTENRLHHFEDANLDLRAQLAMAKSQKATRSADDPEMKQIYEQLKYKDNRIMELNNVIMEKERRIMDLQELCREQSLVAKSKRQAVAIVNRRLQELDEEGRRRPTTRDASTDVDTAMFDAFGGGGVARRRADASPGRAISQSHHQSSAANGRFAKVPSGSSPPPVDPSEDSSFTLDDDSWSDENASFGKFDAKSRKTSKRVTFDFASQLAAVPAGRMSRSISAERSLKTPTQLEFLGLAPSDRSNSKTDEFAELLAENCKLRAALAEARRKAASPAVPRSAAATEHKSTEMDQSLSEIFVDSQKPVEDQTEMPATAAMESDERVRMLRARAVAQSRIRELEANLARHQLSSAQELENLSAINETLKTSREWLLDENGQLLKRNEELRIRVDDLRGQLDASVDANLLFSGRADAAERRADALAAQLEDARASLHHAKNAKLVLHNEVERLKEALLAQDEFIGVLEGDLIVYEAHVGLLRDSLGASKKEQRQTIKSKADFAKFNAPEIEKEAIVKRSNNDRLLAKALSVKVRCLEKERDELLQRLRQYDQNYHTRVDASNGHSNGSGGKTPPLAEFSDAAARLENDALDATADAATADAAAVAACRPPLLCPQARSASASIACSTSVIGSESTPASYYHNECNAGNFQFQHSLRIVPELNPDGVLQALTQPVQQSRPSCFGSSLGSQFGGSFFGESQGTPMSQSIEEPLQVFSAPYPPIQQSLESRGSLPLSASSFLPLAHETAVSSFVSMAQLSTISSINVEKSQLQNQANAVVAENTKIAVEAACNHPNVEELKAEFEAEYQHILEENSARYEERAKALRAELAEFATRHQTEVHARDEIARKISEIFRQISDEHIDGAVNGSTTLEKLEGISNKLFHLKNSLAETISAQENEASTVARLNAELTTARTVIRDLESTKIGLIALNDKLRDESEELTRRCTTAEVQAAQLATQLASVECTLVERCADVARLNDALNEERKRADALTEAKEVAERMLDKMDKRLLEVLVDKESLDQKLLLLQENNSYLSATLEREKGRLERLVNLLRHEVDRFRVEAEISRNCLEDLRLSNVTVTTPTPARAQLLPGHGASRAAQPIVQVKALRNDGINGLQSRPDEFTGPRKESPTQFLLVQGRIKDQQVENSQNESINEVKRPNKLEEQLEQECYEDPNILQFFRSSGSIEQCLKLERNPVESGEKSSNDTVSTSMGSSNFTVQCERTPELVSHVNCIIDEEALENREKLDFEVSIGSSSSGSLIVSRPSSFVNNPEAMQNGTTTKHLAKCIIEDAIEVEESPTTVIVQGIAKELSDLMDEKPEVKVTLDENTGDNRADQSSNGGNTVDLIDSINKNRLKSINEDQESDTVKKGHLKEDQESDTIKEGDLKEEKFVNMNLEEQEERGEFERQLLADIEQLLELKVELETSVDVLKSEVWALNNQLKKQLAEHEEVAQRLQICEQFLANANETLRARDEDVNALQTELTARSEAFERLCDEKVKIEAECVGLAEKCDGLEKQLFDQQHVFDELTETRRWASTLKAENAELVDALATERNGVMRMRRELDARHADVLALGVAKTELEAESLKLHVQMKELQACYESLASAPKTNVKTANKSVNTCTSSAWPADGKQSLGGQQADSSDTVVAKTCSLPALGKNSSAKVPNSLRLKYCSLGASSGLTTSAIHPINIQMAILAARFDAKSADAAALLRANTELAHTNMQLARAVDELETRVHHMTAGLNTNHGSAAVNEECAELERSNGHKTRDKKKSVCEDEKKDIVNTPPIANTFVEHIVAGQFDFKLQNNGNKMFQKCVKITCDKESVNATVRIPTVAKKKIKPKLKGMKIKNSAKIFENFYENTVKNESVKDTQENSVSQIQDQSTTNTVIQLDAGGFAAARFFGAALDAVTNAANEAANALSELTIGKETKRAAQHSTSTFDALLDGLSGAASEVNCAIQNSYSNSEQLGDEKQAATVEFMGLPKLEHANGRGSNTSETPNTVIGDVNNAWDENGWEEENQAIINANEDAYGAWENENEQIDATPNCGALSNASSRVTVISRYESNIEDNDDDLNTIEDGWNDGDDNLAEDYGNQDV